MMTSMGKGADLEGRTFRFSALICGSDTVHAPQTAASNHQNPGTSHEQNFALAALLWPERGQEFVIQLAWDHLPARNHPA